MTAPFKKRTVDAKRILKATQASLGSAVAESDEYEIGRVYEVPLDCIRPNPANARAIYAPAAFEDMLRSLKDVGQSIAATGFYDEPSKTIVLIDGHRRFQGCEKLGWPTLRIEIRPRPESEQGLYLASRAANCERENQTPLDDALVWRRLLDKKVFPNQVTLSKILNLSESEVSRTLALAQMPPILVQALGERPGLLNLKMLNAIREYWQALGEEAALELILKAEGLGLSYRDIENRRKSREAPAKLRSKSDRQLVQFGSGIGALKFYAQEGRVELALTGLDSKEAQELIRRLQLALKH